MDPVYLNGSKELGSVQKTYTLGFGALIIDVAGVIVGLYFFIRGLQLADDYSYRIMSALGDRSATALILLGTFIMLVSALDFRQHKDTRLEICENGIRGKGSTGWFGYKLQSFQLRYDEIVKVENKKISLIPGVCINSRDSEYCALVRGGDEAVKLITELAASWNQTQNHT